MIELNKGVFYSLVASSISVVGPFVLMVVSAALLAPDTFAANASNLYIVMLFSTVVSIQLQSVVLRIDPLINIRDDLRRMVFLTAPRLIPGVILCFAIYVVLTSIKIIDGSSWEFFPLIIASIGYQAYLGLLNILFRREAIKKQVSLQLLFLGGSILCFIVLVFFAPNSEWIRTASMSVAIGLVLIFCLVELPESDKNKPRSYGLHPEAQRYAIWLIPLALSNFVLGYLDKVYASNSLIGEYAKEYLVISHILSALVILPTAINRLIVPKVFDGRLSIYIMKSPKGLMLIGGLFLIYATVGGVVFVASKYVFELSLNSIGFIVPILVITQISRALYLLLVTEMHRQYDSLKITLIALISAIFYFSLILVFHDEGLIAVCICALAAQSLQTIGVAIYVASSKQKTR